MAKKETGATLKNMSPRINYIGDIRLLPDESVELTAEQLAEIEANVVVMDMIANFELSLVK